jgi:hypothetical protein
VLAAMSESLLSGQVERVPDWEGGVA